MNLFGGKIIVICINTRLLIVCQPGILQYYVYRLSGLENIEERCQLCEYKYVPIRRLLQ